MRKTMLTVLAASAVGALVARRRRRITLSGRGVLITGGSRGLGLELARAFGDEGARIALLARDEEELARAAADLEARDIGVITVPCDLRDEEAVQAAVDEVAKRLGRLDILVNNAGVMTVGPLEHMRLDDFREAMDVNFYGPLVATLAARPYLAERGGGRIVNITSIGGRLAFPHLSPYTASKHAAIGLSEGLRAELAKEHILVTTVVPGLMRTGSPRNVDFKGQFTKEQSWFTLFDSLPFLSADAARTAKRIVEAAKHGDPELYITPQAKVAAVGQAAFPGMTARILSLIARFLPSAREGFDPSTQKGYESESSVSPSPLTHLNDVAARKNNELRPPS